MAYVRWCWLTFLQIFIIISFSLPDADLSFTHIQEVGIKVLNVAQELQRETLPLKMGQRFYKLNGLKESSWYEVKISYPASIPASFSLDLKKNLAELQMRTSRRLLNTEKIIFKFDSKKLNSGENTALVLVTVEPAGIVAKPNVQEQELVLFNISYLVKGQNVSFYIRNDCPFEIWPAIAPNVGHPVLANGGFLLSSGKTKRIQAPPQWNGRFWARTDCDFSSNLNPSCQTGDCQGLLFCNGTIGLPPATLVEVSIQEETSKPSFYDVSLVDGYNLPVSVSARPTNPNCLIQGCKRSVNDVCPEELQILDQKRDVIACKSACLAFNQDIFCCRGSYQSPEKCKPSMYSKLFKDACPSYFSYAYDTPTPLMSCSSKVYVITFCPSKWRNLESV
ncbi:thaumatin-like protein [Phalaenopsis equestris]|uniref:thaumatin-like protein n=1 Tax=Phalaenopsis equestris TaxID=78828 RepID=UPI0009E1C4B9|nr:thaumatin-like protein [Phalaenopsis equestris]XP_020574776.1 thaumatin-like protein [Phalaenopsis equestris]